MNTPIVDFLNEYAESGAARFHMPGHKGAYAGLGGCEKYDLTEITEYYDLYNESGMIAESEKNASYLFGSGATFYSTEGSSQCIRAMLRLTDIFARRNGLPSRILACRNAHSTFVTAAGLLGIDIDWIYGGSLLECTPDPAVIDSLLGKQKYAAVYVTSPDYLGNIADVRSVSGVCRSHGTLLIVDNAHGAYLRFADPDIHPLTLGADICCDSAHKTLPVLTGGAYLHISKSRPELIPCAKRALALFGSTSPSHLILRSLDDANRRLDGDLPVLIEKCCSRTGAAKEILKKAGYGVCGNEPMKLTLAPKPYGYTGEELAAILRRKNIYCEFADRDCIVFMPSPSSGKGDRGLLLDTLLSLPKKEPIAETPPGSHTPERAMSIREALTAVSEILPIERCIGRICAEPTVSCPPAVPIAVCGEVIDEQTAGSFAYYGVDKCAVVAL
ncbi:MAG: PLP-dependent transferase [Clostridia bacterium]|nr:PLP-dependent transferase [Clostridia bacterium]